MTDAERLADIRRRAEGGHNLEQRPTDVLWLLDRLEAASGPRAERRSERVRISAEYCPAEIRHRHERFGCLLAPLHVGLHEGYVDCPACPACGGYSLHTADCPDPECFTFEESLAMPDYDVRWADGDTEPMFVEIVR